MSPANAGMSVWPVLKPALDPSHWAGRLGSASRRYIDALDDFNDCDCRLDAGPALSFWRKYPPLIARGCSNCVGDEIHVSPPSFQLEPDNATPRRPESSSSPQAEQFAGASTIKFIFRTQSKEHYQ